MGVYFYLGRLRVCLLAVDRRWNTFSEVLVWFLCGFVVECFFREIVQVRERRFSRVVLGGTRSFFSCFHLTYVTIEGRGIIRADTFLRGAFRGLNTGGIRR